MPTSFDCTSTEFRADLIAEFGSEHAAREAFTIAERDGVAGAYVFAHEQQRLKLPDCKQAAVTSLLSGGKTLAESVVARAIG